VHSLALFRRGLRLCRVWGPGPKRRDLKSLAKIGQDFAAKGLLAIVRGENVITGFRHADLSQQLPGASTNQVSRYIKRLRVHGIIKRVGRRYKYYITDLGRRVVLTGLKLRELFVIPHLNALPSPT